MSMNQINNESHPNLVIPSTNSDLVNSHWVAAYTITLI